jgi:hypothetical protein
LLATQEDPPVTLRDLINGYQTSQALHVVVKLGIADLLSDGSRTSDELAEAVGAHPEALYRLLRAVAALGVLREEADRRFALTELGAELRSDHPRSLAGWAAFIGTPSYWRAWGDLLHSVQTGENAFRHVHGTDPWTYRMRHQDLSADFDRAMASLSRRAADAVLAVFDFSRFKSIIDIGGGNGAFLATILAKHPNPRGVVFDQPHVVAGAESFLREAGVAERCETVGGNFFTSVPAGGDAYLLKQILHDWDDQRCLEILRVCRTAMTPGAALLAIERDLGGPNDAHAAKLSDLNMLVAPGGQERSPQQYADLFEASGFRSIGAVSTATDIAIFEAVASADNQG